MADAHKRFIRHQISQRFEGFEMIRGGEVKAPDPHFVGLFHEGGYLILIRRGAELDGEDNP